MFLRLITTRLAGRLTVPSRAYVRGYWPEPITQTTLKEFLDECNYFDKPQKFINIGAKPLQESNIRTPVNESGDHSESSAKSVDEVIELLGNEIDSPPLNYDDTLLDDEQLVQLAISHGIYRDLFGHYEPNRDHVKFTPAQAERLNKLVPFHWITDQPLARVNRFPKPPEPLRYFEPVIGISARFINDAPNDEQHAHTSYHGNIIQASEALSKPSITLNMRQLGPNSSQLKKDSEFDNWKPGAISFANIDRPIDSYFTIAFLNLDSIHPHSSNLHWLVSNLKLSTNGEVKFDELCDYLPVHGIRGFGYSRYVFLVLQHESEINVDKFRVGSFSPHERKFDCKSFIEQNSQAKMLPVGLSWFQTTWDITSNRIFHDYMNTQAPVYELIQQKAEPRPIREDYPGRVPFNIFLDYQRDKKDINEQVLLERLKNVDPFDYKDQYVPPKVPPTVFDDEKQPSWMQVVSFKKKNRLGYWRGLRPASATLPLNNNADLDYPIRPLGSSMKHPPGFHNRYPLQKKKKIKDLPAYNKPISEYDSAFIQDDHEIHLKDVKT